MGIYAQFYYLIMILINFIILSMVYNMLFASNQPSL